MEAELRKDKVAASNVAPVASLAATWQTFHFEAFGEDTPLLPLTVDILVGIASLYKSGGYRSFHNYVTDAYKAHIEAGYEWSLLLAHTRTWTTRSVMRGIGPARQSCSFVFKKVLALPQNAAPITKGGPQHPVRLALLSTMFLLREIEVGTACISAWTLDHDECELWWNLPASKVDHMELGLKRHWPCTCGLDALCWICR